MLAQDRFRRVAREGTPTDEPARLLSAQSLPSRIFLANIRNAARKDILQLALKIARCKAWLYGCFG